MCWFLYCQGLFLKSSILAVFQSRWRNMFYLKVLSLCSHIAQPHTQWRLVGFFFSFSAIYWTALSGWCLSQSKYPQCYDMQINNWFTQAAHWLCNEASESTLVWNCAASKDINVTAACWYLVHVCQIYQMIWLQIILIDLLSGFIVIAY